MAAVRQGSRWLHEPPTEDEVKAWFNSHHLHPGMEHEPYYGGIVVINATEKIKVTKEKANGDTYVAEVEQAVFVPYVKVDTRIAYFRDYVRTLNGGHERGDFIGVMEPVEQPRVKDPRSAFYNGHLPEGYVVYPIPNKDANSFNRYLIATWRVAIYERQSYGSRVRGEPAVPILQGVGTKQSLLAKTYADDSVLMKAETGAIGRALGVAGILVVGTGVATAEDIQEAQSAGGASAASQAAPPPGESAQLPGVVGSPDEGEVAAEVPASEAPTAVLSPEEVDADLRKRALELQAEMERDHPATWAAYSAWWRDRQFGHLGDLNGPALKGAVVKLERDLDAAKQGKE